MNRPPSPFHFAYFFRNACIGHGGLIAAIKAHQLTRSGAAYAKPHPLVSNVAATEPGIGVMERHYGATAPFGDAYRK